MKNNQKLTLLSELVLVILAYSTLISVEYQSQIQESIRAKGFLAVCLREITLTSEQREVYDFIINSSIKNFGRLVPTRIVNEDSLCDVSIGFGDLGTNDGSAAPHEITLDTRFLDADNPDIRLIRVRGEIVSIHELVHEAYGELTGYSSVNRSDPMHSGREGDIMNSHSSNSTSFAQEEWDYLFNRAIELGLREDKPQVLEGFGG